MNYDELLAPAAKSMRPSGIRKFFDLAAEMPHCISLGVGEPDFKTPWTIRDAGIRSLEQGRTRYTANAGIKELRAEICRYLARRMELNYQPSEVLVTVGGSEAIDLTIRALVKPGDEVIIPEPCFVCYEPITSLTGGVPVHIATKVEDDFRLRADQLRAAITPRTKAIIFNNPTNPTGMAYGNDTLEMLARVAKEYDLLIAADEIYTTYLYEGDFRPLRTLPGMAERTITLNSFSKNFLMTGWRVGVIIAEPELLKVMNDINGSLIYTAPSISQRAAIHALSMRREIREKYVSAYRDRIFYTADRIEKIPYLSLVRPKGTFYLFPGIEKTGLTDDEFCNVLLDKAHVLVSHGKAFGTAGAGHFRIACTVGIDTLKIAFDRMEKLSF